MINELVFDTRLLEAPEPIELIMKNLSNCDETTYIKMIHRMEPKMLFGYLVNNGFNYMTKQIDESLFEIYIFSENFKGEF